MNTALKEEMLFDKKIGGSRPCVFVLVYVLEAAKTALKSYFGHGLISFGSDNSELALLMVMRRAH